MEQIAITHGFVKKLAANIRRSYGRDIRHTEALELVADALGWKAGPLLHALKHSGEVDQVVPSIDGPEAKADGLPPGLVRVEIANVLDTSWMLAAPQGAITRFIEDQQHYAKFHKAGLDPLNKLAVLGSAASAAAGHIAEALGLPMYQIFCDEFHSSGSDAMAGIRAAFEHGAGERRVLLLEGLDPICRERESAGSTDARRLSSAILTLLDDVPAEVIVVGGTNHPGLVDRALWRRFHYRIDVRTSRLDAADFLLHPRSNELSRQQRLLVALVERKGTGDTALLVVEHYDKHPETAAARSHLRRRGCNWTSVQFCRSDDLAAVYETSEPSR